MKKIEFLLIICIFLSFFAAFHPSMNDYLNEEDEGSFNSFDHIKSDLDSSPVVFEDYVLVDNKESEIYHYESYLHYEVKSFPDKAYLIY